MTIIRLKQLLIRIFVVFSLYTTASCLTGTTCTFYRQETFNQAYYQQERYTTKCGLFGWSRCTRYRTVTRYRYATRSVAYTDCCAGYADSGGGFCAPKCQGSFTCPNGGTCTTPNFCTCPVGYYSPSCQACPAADISNCERMSCDAGPTNKVCLQCQHHSAAGTAYELTGDGQQCIPKCSWLNRWCWPGTCSNGRTTSCSCSAGFTQQGTKCQLTSLQPHLLTCKVGSESSSGEAANSTAGSPSECVNEADSYFNFQPSSIYYRFVFNFDVTGVPNTIPNYVNDYHFGITGARIQYRIQSVSGQFSNGPQKNLPGGSCTDSSFSPTNPVSAPITCIQNAPYQGSINLADGERLCLKFIATGGGYVRAKNLVDNSVVAREYYSSVNADQEICLRYDITPPAHCSDAVSSPNLCQTDPIGVSMRLTRVNSVTAVYSGWFDPIPTGGSSDRASGIESYEVTLHNIVDSGSELTVDHQPLINEIKIGSSGTYSLTLPDGPALYAVYLQVLDVAKNVRIARRFVLYDNSSFVSSRDSHPFLVTSANAEAQYRWQIHLESIVVDWTGHFYNTFHVHSNMLKPIRAHHAGLVTGHYEQQTGILAVSGTPNIDGIVNFTYAIRKLPERFPSLQLVSNNINQAVTFSNLQISDRESYEIAVQATDVMGNSKRETVVVHIDSSPPEISNAWLNREGIKQLYVHNTTDLSKMVFEFDAKDPESGLQFVRWRLGTSNATADIDSGSLPVVRKNQTEDTMHSYCPAVGECEMFNYTLTLNHLVQARLHKGNHNRLYYFTVEVKNVAGQTELKYVTIHVDDSAPATGVVIDGPTLEDVEFQSDFMINANWHGFIDHESGISHYIVGVYNRCLSGNELLNSSSSQPWHFIETEERFAQIQVDTYNRYFASVIALNNAFEASEVACSTGVMIDNSPPKITEVQIQDVRVAPGIACEASDKIWFVNEKRFKRLLETVQDCSSKCTGVRFNADLIPFETHGNRTIYKHDTEKSIELCNKYNLFDASNTKFMPTDHLRIHWKFEENESGILDFEIGLSSNEENIHSPNIQDFDSSYKADFYSKMFSGLSEGDMFFLVIKATNKAGLSNTVHVGPIIIDESPPVFQGSLVVTRHLQEDICVSWGDAAFYDEEDSSGMESYACAVGTAHDIQVVLPFTDILSTICTEGYFCCCIPFSSFAQHNAAYGHNYVISVKAQNRAGLQTVVSSDTFRIPSGVPPSAGKVYDLNQNLNQDTFVDVDYIEGETFCVGWDGFDGHYDTISYRIVLSSAENQRNITERVNIENINFTCLHIPGIVQFSKVYATVTATTDSGSVAATSDGASVFNKSSILQMGNVYDGLGCGVVKDLDLHNLQTEQIVLGSEQSHNFNVTGILKNFHPNEMFTIRLTIDGIDNFSCIDMQYSDINGLQKSVEMDFHPVSVPYVLFSLPSEAHFNKVSIVNNCGGSLNITDVHLIHCSIDISNQISTSSLTGYFQYSLDIHEHVSHYDCAILEETCSKPLSEPEMSCASGGRVTPWYNIGREMKCDIKNTHLSAGYRYKILVRPCFNNICLDTTMSNGVLILPDKPKIGVVDILNAGIRHSSTSEWLNIDIQWSAFEVTNGNVEEIVKFYKIAVTADPRKKGSLTTWQLFVNREFSTELRTSVDVNPWHHYRLKSAHVIIKGYSSSGLTATVSKEIHLEIASTTTVDIAVHELLPTDTEKYKIVAHSSNMETKTLRAIHNSEIDFTNITSIISGLVTGPTYNVYHWKLVTTNNPFLDCTSDVMCIQSLFTEDNNVVFVDLSLMHGVKYFICVNTNKTIKERESFTESLPEIHKCGNGFVIDTNPPKPGVISVENQFNGFMTHQNEIILSWTPFFDEEELVNGHSTGVKSYFYGVGTVAGLDNFVKFAAVDPDVTNVIIQNITMVEGLTYYTVVKAIDQVGHVTTVISEPFTMDITPPTCERVLVGSPHHHREHVSIHMLDIHWYGCKDAESGILYVELAIGSENNRQDIYSWEKQTGNTAVLSLDNFIDGHHYHPQIKLLNKAGLMSVIHGDTFMFDSSPPRAGKVRDGPAADIDYQTSTYEVVANWDGFYDPHSGVTFYRAGVAEEDQDVQLSVVGTQTRAHFLHTMIPGRKYFITVEACNNVGLCSKSVSNGVIPDPSPPMAGLVTVGFSDRIHSNYQATREFLNVNWFAFHDPESEVAFYELCIGTVRLSCDITNFTNCHNANSQFLSNLNLPVNTEIFVTVKCTNKAGLSVQTSSDAVVIDLTPPTIVMPIRFRSVEAISIRDATQFETNVLQLEWEFMDPESSVIRHVISVSSHHNGGIPVHNIEIENERRIIITLPSNKSLIDGDRYYALVTSCNAAGLCTSSVSPEPLLVDATPPHLGGFVEPLWWNKVGADVKLNLSWTGFEDPHSGISHYLILVGSTYGSGDLVHGPVRVTHQQSTNAYQNTVVVLKRTIGAEEYIFISLWAENVVGLRSDVIARIRVKLVPSDAQHMHGILDIEKHSCDIQYCNNDCTCAVIGNKCNPPNILPLCKALTNPVSNVTVQVGLSHLVTYTPNLKCLSSSWEADNIGVIQRFEYSLGINGFSYGYGIFDVNDIAWRDVGLNTNITYCLLPEYKHLIEDTAYVFYVRAWYSFDSYTTFMSAPVKIDTSPPVQRRGRHVIDCIELNDCCEDVEFSTNLRSLSANWTGVFTDIGSGIHYYEVMIGTCPFCENVTPVQNIGLETIFSNSNLNLRSGQRYYTTVRAYNRVGLYTTVTSDGVLIDNEVPISGMVYNTNDYHSVTASSNASCITASWRGFDDLQSHIKTYFVGVGSINGIDDISPFHSVSLASSLLLCELGLEHESVYRIAVKAKDSSGHTTLPVFSDWLIIDLTPPVGSVCFSWSPVTVIKTDPLHNHTTRLQYTMSIQNNTVYELSVTLSHYIKTLFMTFMNRTTNIKPWVDHEGNVLFTFTFVSHRTSIEFMSFEWVYMQNINFNIAISLNMCTLESDASDKVVMLSQRSPNTIELSFNVKDKESGILSHMVGLGTSKGGFQVVTLHNVGLEEHSMYDSNLPHGSEVFATVISKNNAGLQTAFYSSQLIVDHTPPDLTNVSVQLVPADVVRGSGTRIYVITSTWTTVDEESSVLSCKWAIGLSANAVDLLSWTEATLQEGSNSIHVSSFNELSHGTSVFISIICSNKAQLSTRSSYGPYVAIHNPPFSSEAQVSFTLPQSVLYERRAEIVSEVNYLHVHWEGFSDPTGIDHYQMRLIKDNETLMGWQKVDSYTDFTFFNVFLNESVCYEATVKAVNKKYSSNEVKGMICVDNNPPKLTGFDPEITINNGNLVVNWTKGFVAEGSLWYDICLGTVLGSCDALKPMETTALYVTVERRKFEGELFGVVRAIKPSGLFEVFSFHAQL